MSKRGIDTDWVSKTRATSAGSPPWEATCIKDKRLKLITALQYLRDQLDTVKIQISIEVDTSKPQVTSFLEVLGQIDRVLIQVQQEVKLE